jgi:hypothetical protein
MSRLPRKYHSEILIERHEDDEKRRSRGVLDNRDYDYWLVWCNPEVHLKQP